MKSQKRTRNLFYIFFIVLLTTSISGVCNHHDDDLKLADSLFDKGKFIQSFEVYEQILADGRVTPAMLLKMAYTKEASDDLGEAMYYLNLYYQQTYNKKVLKKMEVMAEEHQLEGYNYDDYEFFQNLVHRFESELLWFALVLCIFFFSILYYIKNKGGAVSLNAKISYVFLIAIVMVLSNVKLSSKKAIIHSDNTIIMNAPSAGATFIENAEEGHRVEVIGEKDVWFKIAWRDGEGYVKKNQLLMI